jgi:hypothetical protein
MKPDSTGKQQLANTLVWAVVVLLGIKPRGRGAFLEVSRVTELFGSERFCCCLLATCSAARSPLWSSVIGPSTSLQRSRRSNAGTEAPECAS